jgi:CRP-like cAMP-binding protein
VPPGNRRQRRLAAGETLFRQGDRATAIFRIDSGRARLVRHLGDGSQVTLHVARAGETFAEAALFAGSYHCDAVAETESVISLLPKADLMAVLQQNPQAALDVAAQLSRQVRDLRLRLELRNVRPATLRLETWLRLQAEGDPPQVRPDRSWSAIAPELGLTREAVYRALAGLEKAHRIRRKRGVILLL